MTRGGKTTHSRPRSHTEATTLDKNDTFAPRRPQTFVKYNRLASPKPRSLQDGLRLLQDGPKTAQETPKRAPRRPKRAPRRPTRPPRLRPGGHNPL